MYFILRKKTMFIVMPFLNSWENNFKINEFEYYES